MEPGLYFNSDTYFYSGKIGGGRPLPLGGLLVANIGATSWINLPTTIWVTPAKILGGGLAVSLTTPFGDGIRCDGSRGRYTADLPIA
jgi:hypothetical protein